MHDLFTRFRQLPGWFHKAYIADWIVVSTFYALAYWIDTIPVFERDFTPDDPIISHPHKKQRVHRLLLYLLALYTPFLVIFAIGVLKKSLMSLHHGCLSLWLAVCSQWLIVITLKNRVGRLRPDFLARCEWNKILNACTGHPDAIRDGRRSFPSGHSSLAFAGLVFLSLHLGTHIGAFRSCASFLGPRNFLRSRLLRLSIALSPLAIAAWIAVTRLEDYRHHKEDVITGGFIGAFCAYGSYNLYWCGPFSEELGPRNVYVSDVDGHYRGYELTSMEEPPNNV